MSKRVAPARGSAPAERAAPGKVNVFRALLFVSALGIAVALVAKKPSGPPVGDLAAEFDLPDANGSSRVKLSDLRGAPVVVEVFASWCGACRQAAPMLREAALSKRKSDVHFLGVSVDADPRVASRLKESWNIPYAVLHDDGSVAAKYRIQVLPTVIVIDADGHVRHVSSGAPRAATLEAWLGEVGAARL